MFNPTSLNLKLKSSAHLEGNYNYLLGSLISTLTKKRPQNCWTNCIRLYRESTKPSQEHCSVTCLMSLLPHEIFLNFMNLKEENK